MYLMNISHDIKQVIYSRETSLVHLRGGGEAGVWGGSDKQLSCQTPSQPPCPARHNGERHTRDPLFV